tara:strand:+ start:904 stop:1242 length:339 start_codon:yes stop_codon:yes gene_type:complete
MSERTTRPAKANDLIVPNGSHAMKPGDGTPFILRPVLVDGFPAKAGIDSFGMYSTRIFIDFEQAHSEYGSEFGTKYFYFESENPGECHWGHDNKSFFLEVFTDDDHVWQNAQ